MKRTYYLMLLMIPILFNSCSKDDDKIVEPQIMNVTADIESEKINIFYIGVDNPIKVSVTNISNELITEITGEGNIIEKLNNDEFIVKVTKPSDNVEIKIFDGSELIKKEKFIARRIPDPFVRLGNSFSDAISASEFKSYVALDNIVLPNFNYPDAVCEVQGFELIQIVKRQDPVESRNTGSKYNTITAQLVAKARPGDIYLFTNIRVKCNEDVASRRIHPLVFEIQ